MGEIGSDKDDAELIRHCVGLALLKTHQELNREKRPGRAHPWSQERIAAEELRAAQMRAWLAEQEGE